MSRERYSGLLQISKLKEKQSIKQIIIVKTIAGLIALQKELEELHEEGTEMSGSQDSMRALIRAARLHSPKTERQPWTPGPMRGPPDPREEDATQPARRLAATVMSFLSTQLSTEGPASVAAADHRAAYDALIR